ncbi:MAG: hypothetical protein LW832_05850 [Parachlamydia sp.]|jgi:hypothetical protein|nr:hypothetical protein [Parachlamydia sp.]
MDPYERADITSNTYYDYLLNHSFLLVPAQQYIGKFIQFLKKFPFRQKAASFSVDQSLGGEIRFGLPAYKAKIHKSNENFQLRCGLRRPWNSAIWSMILIDLAPLL